MKKSFRLVDRKGRGFYCLDTETGKRFSLQTKNRDDAEQIIFAKNQAIRQPSLNRQIAKAYLSGTDPGMSTRTWQNALEAIRLPQYANLVFRRIPFAFHRLVLSYGPD